MKLAEVGCRGWHDRFDDGRVVTGCKLFKIGPEPIFGGGAEVGFDRVTVDILAKMFEVADVGDGFDLIATLEESSSQAMSCVEPAGIDVKNSTRKTHRWIFAPLIDKPVEVIGHQAPGGDGQVELAGVECHQFKDLGEVGIIKGQFLAG